MVFFLRDFLTFHWFALGARETVFLGVGATGGGLGGFSMTGATLIFLVSGFGIATGVAADLDDGVGAGAGGPGSDTKLTLIDPDDSRRLGADSGNKVIYPIKPKWMKSEIPK